MTYGVTHERSVTCNLRTHCLSRDADSTVARIDGAAASQSRQPLLSRLSPSTQRIHGTLIARPQEYPAPESASGEYLTSQLLRSKILT